ncbi:hypothetical protein ANO11243_072020 [Dothideomycetidae sp. 11243]|nr:hypothetical protein ANO11243_072020 [fungal sp. No.11243]
MIEQSAPPQYWLMERSPSPGLWTWARLMLSTLFPKLLVESFSKPRVDRRRLNPDTSWMDGARGIAALIVLNFHYTEAFSGVAWWGFGAKKGLTSFVSLPFIRLVIEGQASVCLFYTIAGFVNSIAFFHLASQSGPEGALRRLSKSAFRRWFRLYLPTYAVLVSHSAFAYLHGYRLQIPLLVNYNPWIFKNLNPTSLQHLPLLKQLAQLLKDIIGVSSAWKDTDLYVCRGIGQLWTIPMEYHASVVLYFLLTLSAFCRPMARLCILMTFAIICMFYEKVTVMSYVLGAAIAQYSLISTNEYPLVKEKQSLANTHARLSHPPKRFEVLKRPVRLLAYAVALYLMSTPYKNVEAPAPGYVWIGKHLTPYGRTQRALWPKEYGAALLVFLLVTSKRSILFPLFHSRIAQYLGRIMFALYLTHYLVLYSVGIPLPYYIWRSLGHKTMLNWSLGFWSGYAVSLVLAVLLADFWTRVVESRCLKVADWVERICFESKSDCTSID